MTREQAKVEALWEMPKEAERMDSGLMFNEKYLIELTRKPQMMKDERNKLLKVIRSDKVYSMKIANFPGYYEQVESVHITEEIAYRTMSNAIPCENVICRATMTLRERTESSKEVTMKFRKAALGTVTLTETEMRKAAIIEDNVIVKSMFPTVFFVCVFHWEEKGQREYWEGVAMESLRPVVAGSRELYNFNHDAAGILRRMHREGFIHGDPHSGNFMVRSELPHYTRSAAAGGSSRAASGAHVSLSLVPIDFDMVHALPHSCASESEYNRVETEPVSTTDPSKFHSYLRRLVTKIMIIHDYNILLFVNNLHVPFLNRREQSDALCSETDQFYMDMCTKNEEDVPSILFMPWPYAFNWEAENKWDPETIWATLSERSPRLLQEIDKISVADIHYFYMTMCIMNTHDDDDDLPMYYLNMKFINDMIQREFEYWKEHKTP